VRRFLWTADTNGPIVHPPGDIWAWRTMVEWYRQGKAPDSSPSLSGNHTISHLVANQKELGEGSDELYLRRIFVHTSKWLFTCREILRHGASGFSLDLQWKKACCRGDVTVIFYCHRPLEQGCPTFFFPRVKNSFPKPPVQWVPGSIPAGKAWPRLGADHSPPFGAGVMNE
jgi:hypothetical protein